MQQKKRHAQSPKLGGGRAQGVGAPSLKKDYVALRNWIQLCLEIGDTAALHPRCEQVTPYLIQIVSDPSRERRVRAYAAVAIGEMHIEAAIPALGRTLQHVIHERDSDLLMLEIVDALETIATPEAQRALQQVGLG